MLYTIYEMQHAAFAPIRFWAEYSQHLLRNPHNPVTDTPLGKVIAAGCDMVEQFTRRYDKPKFDIKETMIDGTPVVVEEENISRKAFGQLKHFKRHTCEGDPRVLVVAPMSGHFATLLRCTVEGLLPDHDVYITDWEDARDISVADGRFDLDDYVDYLIGWIKELGPNTHILAVCQPCVPVYAAVSLMEAEGHPCTPASMTLMGGPVDARINPSEVNDLATTRSLKWFEDNVLATVPASYAGASRRVYPGFMQLTGFMAMNLSDHIDKHQEMFGHLIHGDRECAERTKAFYEEFRSVADMSAEFYLQTIEVVFQKHLLPKGEWVSNGRLIDPGGIKTTPIMVVEGELDDISGIGQTKAALDISVNLPDDKKTYFMAEGVGHFGIFNGRTWREKIAPHVKTFIRKYDQHSSDKP